MSFTVNVARQRKLADMEISLDQSNRICSLVLLFLETRVNQIFDFVAGF